MDLDGPVAPPPPGVTSNFDNPPNQEALAYSTLTIVVILSTLFTWVRFFVKLRILRVLHVEDYIIPFAWLTAIGNAVCTYKIYEDAPIIHSWDIRVGTFGPILLYARVGALFYNLAIVLIKIACLIQVLRIFVPRGTHSKTYYTFQALILTNSIYYFIIICLMLFTCHPIPKAWKPWLEGRCLDMGKIAMASVAMNLISDLAILALTQKVIWGMMRVERWKRLRVSIVFFAGVVPCAFAVMCLYYSNRQMYGSDPIRDAAYMSLACHGEIVSGLFVLFLPILPCFFQHMRQAYNSRFSSRRGHGMGSSSDGYASRRTNGRRDKSLWHISYSRPGEEGHVLGEWPGQKNKSAAYTDTTTTDSVFAGSKDQIFSRGRAGSMR